MNRQLRQQLLTISGDDNWDDDFPTGISPNGLHLPQLKPQDNFGGLLSSERLKALASDNLKAFASSVDLTLPPKGNEPKPNDNWDANFEGDFNTIRAPMKLGDANTFEMATIRGAGRKASVKTGKPIPRKSSVPKMSQQTTQTPRLPIRSQPANKFVPSMHPALKSRESVEDFSIGFSDDGSVFERPLELLRSKENILSPKLFDIADFGDQHRKPTPRHGNKENSPKEVLVEIQKYVENDGDGDFSDFVSDTTSDDGQLKIIEKSSKSLWPEDDDDEDDPFASMEQGFDEFDMQANIARDKHARMCANIESLVGLLKTGQSEDMLFDVSEQLVRTKTRVIGLC